ncbi:MAG TPA: hypothetical protein VJA46_13070 [Acidimicrobiia bacterium]|nr:hypothetical protein [Acidimicrobiia bacterium]
MSRPGDPFEPLRREAGNATPSDEEFRRARKRLEQVLEREQTSASPKRRWLPVTVAAALVAALVGWQVVRITPAEAALGEIANAARRATPLDVPDGSYIFTTSHRVDLTIRPGADFGLDQENVAYLIPSTREIWRSPDSTFVQIRITADPPEFFDADTKDAYYENQVTEVYPVGETKVEQYADVDDPLLQAEWPTESAALYQALAEYGAQGGDTRPETARVFSLATSLLREANPSPDLRAAIIEIFAKLPVEILEDTDQELTIGLGYPDPTPSLFTITLSNHGYLLAETTTLTEPDPELGTPSGAEVLTVEYTEPTLVESLD